MLSRGRSLCSQRGTRRHLAEMSAAHRYPKPASSLIAQQCAFMMLAQALRLHLADRSRGGVGWLFALADKHLNAALTCMHNDPGHSWTLQKLAARVGMSRSIFALRFKENVGTTPIEYLTRWRMMLASDRLMNSDEPVSVIASSLGYESDSAFGKAFRRIIGCSPRQHRYRNDLSINSVNTTELSYEGRSKEASTGIDVSLS